MEDYIKCELVGGVSLRHLNTFSNLFIVAVYYTYQYLLHIGAIVDCTHVYHAVPYKIITSCFYC